MKKILSIISLLCCAFAVQAGVLLSEDFSSLAKDQTYSGTVNLPSGDWQMDNMKWKLTNSVMALQFASTSSTLITPAVDEPGGIELMFMSSGGNTIEISYSVNGGDWIIIDTYSLKSGKYISYSKGTDLGEYSNVRFKLASTKSTSAYLVSFTITGASSSGGGGGGGGDETEPTNPDPQPEIEWTGPHSVEHCIYVASWAPDDSGDGTWENPYYNLQKAVNEAQPGDTIYVRGGTYYPSAWRDKMSDGKMLKTNKILVDKKGDAEHWFTIKTFPGEFPVLNFKDQPKGTNKSSTYGGIHLSGDYWHIYGLHITQAGDNGIKVEGSHNKVERCTFSYNDDTGLQLGFGHNFSDSHPGISSNDGSYCAYNDIID